MLSLQWSQFSPLVKSSISLTAIEAMNSFFVLLVALLAATTEVQSVNKCTCGIDWSCLNLQKTEILESDKCISSRSTWLLYGNKLRRIPTDYGSAVTNLYISDNELGLGVVDNILNVLTSLKILHISKNSLRNLAFLNDTAKTCKLSNLVASDNYITHLWNVRDCELLVTLIVRNNEITSLPEGAFTVPNWQQKMKEIDISGNPISSIDPKAIVEMRSLITFALNDTGVLSELPQTIFKGLYVLENLFLNGNQISELPEGIFDALEKLKVLHLQQNKLLSLPENIFDHLGNLQILDLDDNLLEEISPRTLAQLHSLEVISVRNNHLKTIPFMEKCTGPLRSASFNGNEIKDLDENSVRAILRSGFEVGDLRENPIIHGSTLWYKNTTDFNMKWETWEQFCGEISLLRVEGHGGIKFCIDNASY